MKKLLLSLLFALVALTGLHAQTIWDGTADTSWYNETNTELEISTAEQLAGLAELVNNGNNFSGKTIMLTADILLNDTSDWENWENSAPANTWTPIGNWPNLFSGTFDGQGHTVSGIYINSENYYYHGLFGYNEGTIKNIGVTESYIKGIHYVGGVCGRNDAGTISNCYNSGTVNGNSYVGGVCGQNSGSGTFSNCYNSGTVKGTGESNTYIGGVCGQNSGSGTFSNCYNSGTVKGTGESYSYIGGVCGYNFRSTGTFSNCYNSGTVSGTGESYSYIGGVCGYNFRSTGEFSNCYNSGTVSGTGESSMIGGVCGYNFGGTISDCYNTNIISGNDDVGGVCGTNSGTISDCYNTGNVNGTGASATVGGMCGNNVGSISNCYNIGTVSGNEFGGGLCGSNHGTISNCYNIGSVSGNNYVGGMCGYNGGTISDCYNTGNLSGNYRVGGACGNNGGSISNCYYLDNSSYNWTDNDLTGENFAKAKSAEQFASGEVCWLLNGNSDANPTWFQTLGTDNAPLFDNTHGTVYSIGNCPNSATFNNNGPSNIRDHSDSDNDGRCDFCGQIILSEPAQSNGIYQIGNRAELLWFARLVNGTLDGIKQNREANAVLTADIIINENVVNEDGSLTANTESLLAWTPIGSNSYYPFSGTFDGQGHSVSGIYINSENNYQGLFCYNDGTIKNVGVTESYIKGSKYVGGICGYNYGSISDCYNSGTISGNSYVGGVCGDNSYGTISNCYNSGTVSGSEEVGGVCGHNYGTISNCYNSGTVSGIGESYSSIGGVCGYNFGSISNCYFLQGTADGGINGNNESGKAEVKTSEQFASGEVCWLLNGSSDTNPTWFQTLNTDDYPVLDDAHTTVYAIGNCPNDINNSYSNQGPSNVGGHTDNDNDFRCDYCGMVMLQEPELSDGVYQISNLAELYWFAGLVNGSLSGVEQNREANAVLTSDITINENVLDANGNLTESTDDLLVWTPIGLNWGTSFYGTFDGQGHSVNGIYINSENNYQGLFGYNSGIIKNIEVIESYIKGDSHIGGMCGYNSDYGTISNCYNSGTINGNDQIGGVCGDNYGSISDCYNSGKVNGSYYVGGVCGYNHGSISDCYNSGKVNSYYYAGGICGNNYDTISNCYYLEDSATGGINSSDKSGQAEAKTAEQFASGEVCWLLNGSSDANPTWFQTINTDDSPVLDNTHGTVYAIGNCPGSIIYNNNSGPSHIGEHADNDHDFRCDYCGMVMLQEPELSEGVYQISNLAELYWFAGLVNGSLDGIEQNTAANAVLTADIIINENVLDANGNLTESTDDLLVWVPMISFSGYFNGQGHTVNGIYINSDNYDQGLISYNEGTIKNVGVTNSYIKGYNVGGICGYNYGSISNCYYSGNVSGKVDEEYYNNFYISGVCGYNSWVGTISNCYNSGTLSETDEYSYAGGVCGLNDGSISNCYYLEGTATGGINGNDVSGQAEAKSAEQFASGEVCWLLNEEQSEGAWGQKLGTDPCPVLGGPAVFKDGETYYNEEGSAIIETNSEQASFVIVSENLTINIYGSDGEATVYNLAGNIVYQGIERIIPVPNPGMYMVRIGNEVQKTIVR